jgi:hypothetical protein
MFKNQIFRPVTGLKKIEFGDRVPINIHGDMQTKVNMDIKNIKSSTFRTTNKELTPHPCQHCEKPCFGLQCKDCHLRMEEDLAGECSDCKSTFRAKKKDGKMRKRCQPCQEKYSEKYIGVCPSCRENYHKMNADGRVFDKCYTCYTSSRPKCGKCDKFAFKDKPLCVECHTNELSCSKPKYEKREVFPCSSKGCKETTPYRFCRRCNADQKSVSEIYMISRCQEVGCTYRGKGSFKYCKEHES